MKLKTNLSNNPQGKLIIAGDFCPVERNADSFAKEEWTNIIAPRLIDFFANSEAAILNLETPLTDSFDPILKVGPTLISAPAAASVFDALNVKAVSTANNHIMDQGVSGYQDTIQTLEQHDISFFGSGNDAESLNRSFQIEINGKRVGLYACAEHEFSIADEVIPGANPADLHDNILFMQELAEQCDLVIVLYHGMNEYCQYPSPALKKRMRAFADAGADFITCQHSHCIGCFEEYNKSQILYGQGDFCFTYGDSNPMRRSGLLAVVDVLSETVEYLPIVNDGVRVFFPEENEKQSIIEGFIERSALVLDDNFLQKEWKRFCKENAEKYLYMLTTSLMPKGAATIYKILYKLHLWHPSLKRNVRTAFVLNSFQCESHNDVIKTILQESIGEYK